VTLLERIDAAASGASAFVGGGGVPSVLRNLRGVLNTRRGSAAAQMDLGTPPPSDLVGGDRQLIERMQRSIGEAIARYEPRLHGVRVTLEQADDDAFLLRFGVRARLRESGDEVAFRTFVDPLGALTVRA
jgi:type VI secretion system protein